MKKDRRDSFNLHHHHLTTPKISSWSSATTRDSFRNKKSKVINKKGDGDQSSDASDSSNDESSSKNPLEQFPTIPYFQIFRFADTLDRIMIVIGTISALLVGAATPFSVAHIHRDCERLYQLHSLFSTKSIVLQQMVKVTLISRKPFS